MLKPVYIAIIFLFFFNSACSDSKQEIENRLLASTDAEESAEYARKAREMGPEGIHIFNEVISSSIVKQDNLNYYAKLMLSLNNLHAMALEGVYSDESIPILLNVLERQRSITDSLITAEILEIITGMDVGYDLEFVNSYTPSDESKRQEMIFKWKSFVRG